MQNTSATTTFIENSLLRLWCLELRQPLCDYEATHLHHGSMASPVPALQFFTWLSYLNCPACISGMNVPQGFGRKGQCSRLRCLSLLPSLSAYVTIHPWSGDNVPFQRVVATWEGRVSWQCSPDTLCPRARGRRGVTSKHTSIYSTRTLSQLKLY